MKILYKINKVVFIITLILYLTIFLGLYAQIVLGAVQLISALFLFAYWNDIAIKTKQQLYVYWLVVILYGIGWLIKIDIDDLWWLLIIIIPMSIASYFLYIINSIKNLLE